MSGAEHVCLNGEIVRRGAARISALDRGFLYGDGFFETTRIVAGVPLLLGRHLERLAASCAETGFGHRIDVDTLAADVGRLIEADGIADGYLRITVSRGPYDGRLAELAAPAPTVLIDARRMELPPLDGAPPIALAPAPYRRDERSPLVRHKSLSYQLNVLALAAARTSGADEAYFLNSRGQLAEGAISNLFLVAGGEVRTPAVGCGLLPGITREAVLTICAEEGISAQESAYGEEALAGADEVFCTNSLRGVMPVREVLGPAGKSFGERPVTLRIQRAYAEAVREGGRI